MDSGMEDTIIRGKALSFALFAIMILSSMYIQRQQAARFADSAAVDGRENSGGAVPDSADGGRRNNAGAEEGSADGGRQNNAGAEKDGADADLPRRIALTFDDGPHPCYTKILLDGLRERGVKATFFVIGKNIPGREALLKQMAADGHIIGNHTYDHTDISTLSSERACEELKMTSDLVEQITGKTTPYVRAPFGNWSEALDCRVSMIAVGWTIDPMDWATRNTAQVVDQVVADAEDNGIILLHDYYQSSVEAALQIVDELTRQGFEFVTVEDLLLE